MQCVFSGSTENLNTSMNVKMDDGSVVEAWISDEYADYATPSQVRKRVMEILEEEDEKAKEVRELMEKAEKLGLVIMPKNSGEERKEPEKPKEVQEEAKEKQPAPQAKPRPAAQAQEDNNDNRRIIDGREADARKISPVANSVNVGSQQVSGTGSEYDIITESKPSVDLKAGEQAEIGTIKGRGGVDIAVPIRRKGLSGETKVSVVDTGGDNALQNRFRQLANSDDPFDFIHNGYQVKTIQCPLCRGNGIVPGGKSCPKCGGGGSIDISS